MVQLNLKNPELLRKQAYVHGEWVEAQSGRRFDVLDPGSNQVWASVPDMAVADVEAAVGSAHRAFAAYSRYTPRQRADLLVRWDQLIKDNWDDLATILMYETGKPLAEAYGELTYAETFLRWFAGEAERVQGTTFAASAPGRRVVTIKQPLGVTAALVPWNFPIAMILRKVSTALAAGCTMIAKPSPETPLSCLSLAYLATQAGFPPGAFNVLTTTLDNTPSLCEAICAHKLVKKISFTGSTRVGKILASQCAGTLKKLTFELGGNCPFLVFDDANLEQAAEALVQLKFRHAGQACITANRVYVQRGVYDEFAALIAAKARALKVGHGSEEGVTMGPVTVPQGITKCAEQVEDARRLGATVLCGGQRLDLGGGGYFFEPTVLKDATAAMRIHDEESFAPVLPLFPFDTEDEAVEAANNTSMGLASYCFTKNVDRTWRLLENLEAGMIGLNTGNSSATESPFGGIKESGYGKESGKDVAINEYLITKTGTLTLEGHY